MWRLRHAEKLYLVMFTKYNFAACLEKNLRRHMKLSIDEISTFLKNFNLIFGTNSCSEKNKNGATLFLP